MQLPRKAVVAPTLPSACGAARLFVAADSREDEPRGAQPALCTPGSAESGQLFAAFRAVVSEHGPATSWLDLLQLTNERLCAWSAARPEQPLPSMEISSTCRGAAFGPGRAPGLASRAARRAQRAMPGARRGGRRGGQQPSLMRLMLNNKSSKSSVSHELVSHWFQLS